MVAHILEQALDTHADALCLMHRDATWSFGALARWCRSVAQQLNARNITRIALYARDTPEVIAVLGAAAYLGVDVCVLNRDDTHDAVAEQLRAYAFDVVCTDDTTLNLADIRTLDLHTTAAPPDDGPLWDGTLSPDAPVTILTTGTTGVPKAARYTWARLAAQIRVKTAHEGSRWLMAYHLNHFAAYQVLFHAWMHRAALVLPASTSIDDALSALEHHGVTHISATPTFFRFALARAGDATQRWALRHITLGGEAPDANLLDTLRTKLPDATLAQVFATTELGSCMSVQDGREGLPVSILDRPEDATTRFKVVDGELFIRSQHGMLGYHGREAPVDAEGWRPTGDMVAIRGDRLHFLGRRSSIINVGGVKVYPGDIEAALAHVDGAQHVRAWGKPNPITGRVIALDVVLADGADAKTVRRALKAAAKNALGPHAQPRIVRFVEALEQRNRKISRR